MWHRLSSLMTCEESDVAEFVNVFRQLPVDARTMLLANLSVLSLMQPLPDMPDPHRGRELVEPLIARLRS